MRVKILDLSKRDAYYPVHEKIIGLVGEFLGRRMNKWATGRFICDHAVTLYGDDSDPNFYFASVKVEVIHD